MGQEPRSLAPHISARHFFGAELRHWRHQLGLSQDQVGRLVHVSGDTVAKVEKAQRWPPQQLATALDAALGTGGALGRLWPLVDAQRRSPGSPALGGDVDNGCGNVDNRAVAGDAAASDWMMSVQVDEEGNVWAQVNRRTLLVGSVAALIGRAAAPPMQVGQSGSVSGDEFGLAEFACQRWPGLRLSRPVPDFGVDVNVLLPGGRALPGASVAAQIHPTRYADGRVLVEVEDLRRLGEFAAHPGRTMVVGADRTGEAPRFYLVDTSHLPGRLPATRPGRAVRVPAAYELDDFTYGIVWAALNLDDALQADDQVLTQARTDLAVYEPLPSSAVSREAVAGLNPVGRMWLGSDFCARHILRTLPGLPQVPTFWTREQRGEEASTWLLFEHKYRYLQQTMQLMGTPAARAFCIPHDAVEQSTRPERTLLFLAAALMESLGIHIQVSTEPEHGTVEGFVLAGSQQAIIANWVHGDGMWHVDVTSRAPVVRRFTDIAADVAAHSVVAAPTPAGRLQALAGYLDLDWAWVTRRCGDLGRHGTAGLIATRSRLVSAAGLDAACAFVGSLQAHR